MGNQISKKEAILNKIKQALVNPVPLPFTAANNKADTLVKPLQQEVAIEFAENFTELQGKFVYCSTINEAIHHLQQLVVVRKWQSVFCAEENMITLLQNQLASLNVLNLAQSEAAITTCDALVARTGSFLLSSATSSGRTTSVYTPVHICIAYTSQLAYDIKEALQMLQQQYGHADQMPSFFTLSSGPSRTADIEKTLVVGVHGPKEVFCFLVDDSSVH